MAKSVAHWKEGCRYNVMRTVWQIHFHVEEQHKGGWNAKLVIWP